MVAAAANNPGISISVLRLVEVEGEEEQGTDSAERSLRVLSLAPKPWAGRGLLGCHIVKYDAATDVL